MQTGLGDAAAAAQAEAQAAAEAQAEAEAAAAVAVREAMVVCRSTGAVGVAVCSTWTEVGVS